MLGPVRIWEQCLVKPRGRLLPETPDKSTEIFLASEEGSLQAWPRTLSAGRSTWWTIQLALDPFTEMTFVWDGAGVTKRQPSGFCPASTFYLISSVFNLF